MKRRIAVIAPLIDESQFNLDYTIRVKETNADLSIALLYQLLSNGQQQPYHGYRHEEDIPAAGYYLQGILRLNGYDTILTNRYDTATLKKLSSDDPFAICISTTMILKAESFISLIHAIEKEMPGVPIISGGMFLWKQYLQFEKLDGKLGKNNFFFSSNVLSASNILVVSQHGISSMLSALKEIETGSQASFSDIPNLCLPQKGSLHFTKRTDETIDFNTDYTRWDLADEIPTKVPLRTSVGCPYRCGFCDFCTLFPRIYLRSAQSIKNELKSIHDRAGGKATVINVTDDNVFITSKRLLEVCDIFSNSGLANWMGFMRGNVYSPDELKAISNSGLRMAMIGVESGDQDQLGRMNKHQDAQRMSRGIAQLDGLGITTLLTFVVGYPGETSETLDNTARFLTQLDLPNYLTSYQMYPLLIQELAYLSGPAAREKWNIKGSQENWSHYTMTTAKAVEACHQLFRNVDGIPYHYPSESYFFNRGMFSREKLMELYRLRHRLTVNLMDAGSMETQSDILAKMAEVMELTGRNDELSKRLVVNAER